MYLEELKSALSKLTELRFVLEDGHAVPAHFHVTEIGDVTKHYIDCGGVVRLEKVLSMQLWDAKDTDHRLAPEKLLKIIEQSEQKLSLENKEIEVQYQLQTIGIFSLAFNGSYFILKNKQTACLANTKCGPDSKRKIRLCELQIIQQSKKKETGAKNCNQTTGCC